MVSGDPQGGQGECRGAQEQDQREQATNHIWSIFGTSDEYQGYRAIDFCEGSGPSGLERGHGRGLQIHCAQ
jgi:hypothetical protein